MSLDPTSVDLLQLQRRLADALGPRLPGGLLEGKTALRDYVVTLLACSELEAERMVDTLEARGFIQYLRDPRGEYPGAWRLERDLL